MVARIGEWVTVRIRDSFYGLGFFFLVLKETLSFLRTRQASRKVLSMQILFTGVEAVGVIAVMSLALGAVIIVQGLSLLPQLGQSSLIYTLLIIVITRELGPLLTAFVVAARSGTAIATELGNMVINHEVEAYMSAGINPVSYLVVPRFIGVTVSTFVLNLYFNVFGLIGSFLVTQFTHPVRFSEYYGGLLAALSATDVATSLIKSVVFGAIISTVATYYGFKVERAPTEVPQMAIHAVGRGVVLCIVADAVITILYYAR